MSEVENGVGSIKIANEVVGIIAGLAATEVEGVAGMSGGIAGGIADILRKNNLSKGVRVEVGETEAAVDLYTIMKYGVKIPEVSREIQENVKRSIESMTGLDVVEVNVHVQGISFEDEEEEQEEEEEVEEIEEVEVPRVR
ncbi:alkaline-shock protein [Orenia metallireducens]|uniref:Alkaline-shock protein n=1 Tax=Orenia metallireducens TaxID=1413210 RepID=A0A1C0A9I8_9FIRM|nr:Asp23/Gls24 family envelope stress response protein [Orenia metallireducens]OCL26957.1 alkaline-shock protein [Orenia metallireducens]